MLPAYFLVGKETQWKTDFAPPVPPMINRKRFLGAFLCILILCTRAHAQIVFAHFAQGGGYQTTFTLTNLSNIATTATIQLYLDDGTQLPSLVIPLRPNGTGKAALSETQPGVFFSGWARVSLSPPADVAALETIGDANIPSTAASTSLRFPAIER